MRIEQDATNAEIARAHNVSPHRVAIWLRGLPMKNWRRASQKYGPHEAAIRRGLAAGKSFPELARELGFPRDTGLRQFAERLGLYVPATRAQAIAAPGQSAVSGTADGKLDLDDAAD
jgi:hypothetical protein